MNNSNEVMHESKELSEICIFYDIGNSTRQDTRQTAYDDIQRIGQQYHAQTYSISTKVKTILDAAHINSATYEKFSGNQLQQVLHQEHITMLEQLSLPLPSCIVAYKDALLTCIDGAHEYNQVGIVFKSLRVTDFCWALLDYSKAVVDGIAAGTIGAVKDCLEHPIGTTACVVAGEYVLAYQLSKMLWHVTDIGITYAIDPQHGKEKLCDYIKPVSDILAALQKKEFSLRSCIKTGVQLITHVIAQGKLLSGLHKLYTKAQQHAVHFIKEFPTESPEKYFETAEGIIMKVSHEMPDQKNVVHNTMGSGEKVGRGRKVMPPVSEGPLCVFTQSVIDTGVMQIMRDANKIRHIFANADHKLDPLVAILGGQENTIRAVLETLNGKLPFNGIFYDFTIEIAGNEVLTRGVIINGIPKLGTLFINKRHNMDWKNKLDKITQTKQWDVAIEFMQMVIEKDPSDVDAYIYMNYLLMNILVHEKYDFINMHDCYAKLCKQYFEESYAKFSDNSEYLFYTSQTAYMSEWYFGLELDDVQEMWRKAMQLDPDNFLYKFPYFCFIRGQQSQGDERIVEYAKIILTPVCQRLTPLSTKGPLGFYIARLMTNWAKEVLVCSRSSEQN